MVKFPLEVGSAAGRHIKTSGANAFLAAANKMALIVAAEGEEVWRTAFPALKTEEDEEEHDDEDVAGA